MAKLLSRTQALRVVGQELDALGISVFELTSWGDDYVVWPKQRMLGPPGNTAFFSRITRKILGHGDKFVPTRLYFSEMEIIASDGQRKLNRKATGSPTDRRDMAFVLRVLGDYLDRRNARQFAISYSSGGATVHCDQKRESFTAENLYDFGIHMYLKRSSRDRPT